MFGPTAHTAKPAAAPKTGRFALLRGPHPAPGSGAPSRSLIITPLITLCAFFAVLALSALAQAESTKLILSGTFASEGPGVAVDQSSGDVFTAGFEKFNEPRGPGQLNKFDAAGDRISPPSTFGEPSAYAGAVVNPVNQDLYVLTMFAAVNMYDPGTGALLSSFSVASSANFFGALTDVQIAADSAGNVYVPVVSEDKVLEYDPATCPAAPTPCVPLKTFTGGSGQGALKEPNGVAVDSAGDLWVADTGNDRIEELSPTGAPVEINGKPVEIKSEGVRSVALDRHGNVFALVNNGADSCGSLSPPCDHLLEYSSAGVQLADVGAGDFGIPEGGSLFAALFYPYLSMLAVNESDDHVYVTDDAKNTVWVFAPPIAPTVTKELDAEVSTTEAKLGALITAGGIASSYRFEYDTREYAEGEGPHGQSTPFPPGSALGTTARTVWASASGLAPGTTYHYRVVVTNELGTAVGPDQTFTTLTAKEAECENEQFRGGFSASLPDCRAYELVTPSNTASAEPDTFNAAEIDSAVAKGIYVGGGIASNFAARNGERFSYRSAEVLPGAESAGFDYLATRGASGWSSEDVIPLQSYDGDRCTKPGEELGNAVMRYSSELTDSVVRVGAGGNEGTSNLKGGCGAQGLEVVAGEPLGVENLLLRDNATGAYRLLDVPPAGVIPTNARFHGGSADLGHVVFSENARLTADAPAGVEDLYEWDEGAIRLVTILPNGNPVVGSLAQDPGSVSSRSSVVSAEGARVFFTADGNLYVRVDGEETVQLDQPRGGSGPGGGGSFQAASADGTQALFTDEASAGLTSDTVAGSGTNLYRYANGQLTDLTSAAHAEVVRVSGISEDGSYVYFVADGVLSGSQANERGETAQAGRPNMYLSHGGSTTFIATPGGSEEDEAVLGAVRVSPNGAFLAFSSKQSLTGYDNTSPGEGTQPEIFLYSVASDRIVCVSCSPSGEPPSAGGATFGEEGFEKSVGEGTPHYLTNSGQVFFQTQEALLPRDTNGEIDVYEYENGQLSLISAGTSSTESVLLDVSENGRDVFFLSTQDLVAQDNSSTETLVIYDARVDGGFPAVVSPPACTTADACRTPVPPQPSLYGAPPSQTFSGAGNLAPPTVVKPKVKPKSKPARCKRGFVKKKGKCVKRSRKKARKSAHANRTGK